MTGLVGLELGSRSFVFPDIWEDDTWEDDILDEDDDDS